MRIEDESRIGVGNERVNSVMLSDGQEYRCKMGSFAIWSPLPKAERRTNGGGTFIRFLWMRPTSPTDRGLSLMWVECPLTSMVAVGYAPTDEELREVEST